MPALDRSLSHCRYDSRVELLELMQEALADTERKVSGTNDEFCINNDEICIENEGFCISNDESEGCEGDAGGNGCGR